MGKKKKREVLQKKPFAPLYFIARHIYARLIVRLKYNVHYCGVKIKGPALILSNHSTNHDYKFVAGAVGPARISFLVSYHWFTFKKFAFWLKVLGAIPKYQFATDLAAMRKIQYVVQKNEGTVYIAPEGTVYASGHLGYISPSIAKMIRFLKVPVYTCKIEGAGLGNAKWSTYKHRGKVQVTTAQLFTSDEAKTLDKDTILERVKSSLAYDDFEFGRRNHVKVSGPNKAEGFDTMFYKCPCCGSEFKLKASGNDVTCTECGATATFQDDFTFKWSGDTQYFENYSQWYDWQYEKVKEEVSKPDFKMESEMDYGIDIPGVNNYTKVGHGVLTFSHSGWDYKGTFKDQEIQEHDDPREVFLATLKIGKHIELPVRDGHNRVFYPKVGNESMKWHIASRAMSEILNS